MALRLKQREAEIDNTVKATLLQAARAVNLAIQQGGDLLLAKAQCRHGEFEDWLKKNFVKQCGKTIRRAQQYMKLAVAAKTKGTSFFENAGSIEEAFRLLGLLPEIEHVQSDIPQLTLPPIFKPFNFIAEWLAKDGDSLASWERPQLEELRQRVKPAVELHERIEKLLRT